VPLTGTSPAITVRSGGGATGEGKWWWDGFCFNIDIVGTADEVVFIWTDASASASGPGAFSPVVAGSLYAFQFASDGTATISASTAGTVAHHPAGLLNIGDCCSDGPWPAAYHVELGFIGDVAGNYSNTAQALLDFRPGPYIQVQAIGNDGSFVVAITSLSGDLTFPITPILTITDTDVTMTVQGYSVTASYADGYPGPVSPPDFATESYGLDAGTTYPNLAGSVSYENIIGNGTNFGGGRSAWGVTFRSPVGWTGPFVGQVTLCAPVAGIACDPAVFDNWLIQLTSDFGSEGPKVYEGYYYALATPPFIAVHARGEDFGIMDIVVRTDLPGPLTFPITPILTITDTDVTMTVQGYSVTASYAAGSPGPVPPPSFAASAYGVLVQTDSLPPCGVSYENVIGNGTNFGGGGPFSGTGGTSYSGPWTDPFVGQVTFLAPA